MNVTRCHGWAEISCRGARFTNHHPLSVGQSRLSEIGRPATRFAQGIVTLKGRDDAGRDNGMRRKRFLGSDPLLRSPHALCIQMGSSERLAAVLSRKTKPAAACSPPRFSPIGGGCGFGHPCALRKTPVRLHCSKQRYASRTRREAFIDDELLEIANYVSRSFKGNLKSWPDFKEPSWPSGYSPRAPDMTTGCRRRDAIRRVQ